MRTAIALFVVLTVVTEGRAYVEAPHSLGRVVAESHGIVLVEVTKVNKEKGIVIYKKVEDLKGKFPKDELKHNIGKRGFHMREWTNILDWAVEGKRAVFFHNGGASETCIGTYWYQCYSEGEWWGMTHAEPFLLRTFFGEPEKLVEAVKTILSGKEVIVPCLMDANKDQMHLRKGKLHMMKASLKLMDYNPKRDFAGFGDGDWPEFRTVNLLAESSAGWRFMPEHLTKEQSERWMLPNFDDATWREGRTPIGQGEEEIVKRKGTIVPENGKGFFFRRVFNVPPELLDVKGAIYRLSVASDDNATVFINGKLADKDPEPDHEFAYWNREVDLPPGFLKAGQNVVAAYVRNGAMSSDLYLDMDISVLIELPRKKKEK